VLFRKRFEVKEAHDLYANTEIAYLLQKAEKYEGVVFLATNQQTDFSSLSAIFNFRFCLC